MISAALSVLKTDEERNIVEKLYTENRNRFLGIAYSRLNNRADAEEAVQEAFLRISAKPDTFFRVPDNKKVAFVDIVIRNVAIETVRKKAHFPQVELDEDIPDSMSVEEQVIGEISYEKLADFVRNMPETLKSALTLRINFDVPNTEIAELLGISYSAAKRRISDAMKMIREYIESENNNEL